jgi:ribA/ribD-fused uncharacterized protein
MAVSFELTLVDMSVPVINSFRDIHACLSNFYHYPVNACGWLCPTNEHGLVLSKCATSWDKQRVTDAMSSGSTPGMAKRMGRHVDLRKEWEAIKIPVMTELIRQKFVVDSFPGKHLMLTYPSLLVEGNVWHDQFWGDCRCDRSGCVEPGQNWLGRLLMVRRAQLLDIL